MAPSWKQRSAKNCDVLGVARRGGQQVAAGLECLVAAAEPGFEPGDLGQVLGPRTAVEPGQLRSTSAASPSRPAAS